MIEKRLKKEDLRIRMSRKLLVDALLSLLEEKSFEELHVSDICDRAMVHRTTFYNHFEDKYHLLQFTIKEIQNNFEKEIMMHYNYENPRHYYMEFIKKFLSFLSKNKKMYLLIMETNENSIMKMFHKLIVEDVTLKFEKFQVEKTVPVPIPVIAEFHVGGLLSLSIWWLKNNKPFSDEDIYKFVDFMIRSDF